MPSDNQFDTRRALLGLLLQTVDDDLYPSTTMLDMIEQMLTPDEVPFYTRLLLRKISADRFPSMPMIARVKALT
ncbi:MAG TPA: hypothetical protein VFQ19_01175 [Nocardioidaceae bacterium]|nr:hypothetical protein [Nocardioidaceae bacterium]